MQYKEVITNFSKLQNMRAEVIINLRHEGEIFPIRNNSIFLYLNFSMLKK